MNRSCHVKKKKEVTNYKNESEFQFQKYGKDIIILLVDVQCV